MSFVNCPKCNTMISDKENICSKCGSPSNSYWSELYEGKEIEKSNKLGDEMRAQGKYTAAKRYYAIGAALENTYAQIWLGNMYRDGLGGGSEH